MFVSHMRVCVVYIVKEVASFWGARSINGRGALDLYNLVRPAGRKLLVALCRNWN